MDLGNMGFDAILAWYFKDVRNEERKEGVRGRIVVYSGGMVLKASVMSTSFVLWYATEP